MLTAYGAARCCSGGDGLQQTSQGVIVGRCRVGTPYLNEFGSVMKIHTDIQYNAQYKANVCLVFSSTAEIVCLQGKTDHAQWKYKAKCDLVSGKTSSTPTPKVTVKC